MENRTITQTQNTGALLSSRAVAKILGLSPRTIHRLNSSGLIIKPLRISGSVRYVKSELMAWIQAKMPRRSEWEAMKEAENVRQ
jgi:predicted DNA-binding transcriptional regulator AlpA